MEYAAWLEKSRLLAERLPPEMKGRWQTLDQIGLPQPYEKTHNFGGEFINDNHRKIGFAPTGRRAFRCKAKNSFNFSICCPLQLMSSHNSSHDLRAGGRYRGHAARGNCATAA
jgi:hypothetical protein